MATRPGFSAKGRKDFAYAAMYAYVAFLVWLKGFEDDLWLQSSFSQGMGGGGGLNPDNRSPGQVRVPQIGMGGIGGGSLMKHIQGMG